MMNSHKQLFSHLLIFQPFLFLLLWGQIGIQAEARQLFDTPNKLFVFGDSYVDTGNSFKGDGSWKVPYGMTFPGKPAGRFSDGRVLTDYLANYLGLESPVPYESRNDVPSDKLKYGINFAYGGTGLFNTGSPNPNMSVQINFLEQLIKANVYNVLDLSNSMAMLSAFGNDYLNITKGATSLPPVKDIIPFIESLVDRMTKNLIRVQSLGVKKVAVTSVPPFGCIPLISVRRQLKFESCFELVNVVPILHNKWLKDSIDNLNKESSTDGSGTTFIFLDLYDSFKTVINDPSSNNITNSQTACCLGVSKGDYCSLVGENGEKKYTVCEHPESTLFWDPIHPTQGGWQAVFNKLQKGDIGHLQF